MWVRCFFFRLVSCEGPKVSPKNRGNNDPTRTRTGPWTSFDLQTTFELNSTSVQVIIIHRVMVIDGGNLWPKKDTHPRPTWPRSWKMMFGAIVRCSPYGMLRVYSKHLSLANGRGFPNRCSMGWEIFACISPSSCWPCFTFRVGN